MIFKKTKSIFPKIAVAAIIIFLLVIIFVLQAEIKSLNEQREILKATVKLYQDEVDELQYDFTLSEKEYIEKYAREKLGFHKTGEIVFKNSN